MFVWRKGLKAHNIRLSICTGSASQSVHSSADHLIKLLFISLRPQKHFASEETQRQDFCKKSKVSQPGLRFEFQIWEKTVLESLHFLPGRKDELETDRTKRR